MCRDPLGRTASYAARPVTHVWVGLMNLNQEETCPKRLLTFKDGFSDKLAGCDCLLLVLQ